MFLELVDKRLTARDTLPPRQISTLRFIVQVGMPIFVLMLGLSYSAFTWPLVLIQAQAVGSFVANPGNGWQATAMQSASLKPSQYDTDGDGLLDKNETYIFSTDVAKADTDGDGMNDGEEVALGRDPLDPSAVRIDTDGDWISDFDEVHVFATDPNKTDSDNDGLADGLEVFDGTDPALAQAHRLVDAVQPSGDVFAAADLHIGKLKLDAPIAWNASETADTVKSALEHGVAHYSQSSPIGSKGLSVIAGHSSNFSFAAGDYNNVFARLNDMNMGDVITITQGGKTYTYKVTNKKITKPDWQEIYQPEAGKEQIALLTCYPIGTSWKRLVVIATRVQ